MPSDLSIEKRLLLSAVWYPALISTLLIYFMGKSAETGFKSIHKFVLIIISLISYSLLSQEISYFTSGNVDHHSLQILLWTISLWLFLSRPTVLRSASMGLALGTWIWISPEALPFIFTIYCILGIESLFKPHSAKFATITSLSVVATTTFGLLLETPLDKIFSSASYDTLSIVYVIFFVFCSSGFIILTFITQHVQDFKKRLLLSLSTACVLAAAYLMIYPKFLKGPMAEVDPYILKKFLPNINEAMHLFSSSPHFIISSLFLPLLACILTVPLYKKHLKILTLLVLSFLMTLAQIKWSYYLETLSIILIAKLLPGYARYLRKSFISRPYLRHICNAYLILIGLCFATFLLTPSVSANNNSPEALSDRCQLNAFYLIESGQLQKVLGDKTIVYESNILANSGIPFFTPYHYVGSNYHREGSFGMQEKYAIFESNSLEKIRPILKKRGVSAMMICPAGGNVWPNQYFTDTPPPLRSWIKIYQNFDYPLNLNPPLKPILLMIEP